MESDELEGRQDDGAEGPTAPRSWLTPYLLMLLRSWEGYGYELVRHLTLFGFGWVDPGTVYRALRDLERKGCVVSRWDTSTGSGPARRIYTITDVGIEALGLWANTLDSYRQMIERFFQQYDGRAPSSGAEDTRSSDREASGP